MPHSLRAGARVRLGAGKCAAARRALTLVEMMVTMAIFSLVVIALVYTHLFGLKQDELVESKLGASDQARRGFDEIVRDIRCAKRWRIGTTSDGSTFTPIPGGTDQQGNALQLSFTNNYVTHVLYYFVKQDGDNQLRRFHTGDSTDQVIASDLTDPLYFTAENYAGDIQSDIQWRYIVHFTLNFRQYQYPLTYVGTNYLYDQYKLEFRVTPHAPD